MAAPESWRIKGVDKATQEMAAEAAERSGLAVGEWLENTIDSNVGVLLPEEDTPLVPAELLESVRDQGAKAPIEKPEESEIDKPKQSEAIEPDDIEAPEPEEPNEPKEAKESDEPESINQTADLDPEAALSDDDRQQPLPLLTMDSKDRKRQVPNVSPMLIAALPRQRFANLPRILGGLAIIALFAGAYWLIDENTINKMLAETDAVAGRSAMTSDEKGNGAETADEGSNQGQSQQNGEAGPSTTLSPLQKLTALANSGNAEAQQELGLRFVQGNGVVRDAKHGAEWLEKSANGGMPSAQFEIGILYQKGLGVSTNNTDAFKWFLKSARQGHVRAQFILGTLYADGKGTKQDYEEATRWITRASRAGLTEAHYSLGQLHEDGLGVERNQRKTASYYRSALAASSARAAGKLTRLEPALRELSAAAEVALLETDVTPSTGDASRTPAKDRKLSSVGIRKLQQLLKKLDLEPGPADGVLGDKTKEAIRLYQRFAGLPVDGKPTLELLLDLRQVVGAMSAEKPATSAP